MTLPANKPKRPTLLSTQALVGPDGTRTGVKVRWYDDGSLRFEIDKLPLSLDEAYLSGGMGDHAIIKVRPR
jgi:hypothetical protein